ncbi:Boletus edulis lectin [Psilocybe cubensis]|nr:Boletus edulis lectin [Psilocybe cubensis]KAH9477095.1 Boletus edulis lectin [Psilocybe cubensis]
MSYSIATRTYQTNTNAFFRPVEKTVWNYANGGTWTPDSAQQTTLTMGGSGTSGILRFASDSGESHAVVLGVHNYVRWCDIITDIPTSQTATTLHPLYYAGGNAQSAQREKQLASCSATAKNGRTVNVVYTVATGNNLSANIVIG